jgi:hypothetical protein
MMNMNKKFFFFSVMGLLCIASLVVAQPGKSQDSCMNFFVSALCWQPREDGLDYMIKNSNGAIVVNAGSVERAEFDWNGGFRVGATYNNLGCCPIAFTVYYTRFTTDGCDKVATTFPTVLFPIWSNPSTNIVYEQEAKARLCLSLNTVDAQISTVLSPNDCVNLMPMLGLRFARIHQNFNISANSGQTLGHTNFVVDDAITMQNNFIGAGPKVGISSTWGSWCGWSIVGAMDVALLYGRFDLKQKEAVEFPDEAPITYLDIACNRFNITRPNIDLSLGLQWEQACGCYDVIVSAAWEHQYFFGQNQLLRFSDDINPGVNSPVQGDLAFQGLTFNVSVAF